MHHQVLTSCVSCYADARAEWVCLSRLHVAIVELHKQGNQLQAKVEVRYRLH